MHIRRTVFALFIDGEVHSIWKKAWQAESRLISYRKRKPNSLVELEAVTY